MRSRLSAAVLVGSLAVGVALAGCGDDESAEPPSTAPLSDEAQAGATLARDNGCTTCHSIDGGRSTGPSFVGLVGSEVELDDGSTVTADAGYLERSIRDPRAQVRSGYASVMPTTFELSDDEVAALIAYIEALGSS